MERLSFGAEDSITPAEELLDNVTVAPLTGAIAAGAPFQAAVFRLGPGGAEGLTALIVEGRALKPFRRRD